MILIILVVIAFSWISFSSSPSDNTLKVQSWEGIKTKFGTGNGETLTAAAGVIYKYIADDLSRLTILFSVILAALLLGFSSKIDKYSFITALIVIHLIDIWYIDSLCVKSVPIDQPDQKRQETAAFLSGDTSLYRVMPTGELATKNWFATEKIQSTGGYHGVPLRNYFEAEKRGMLNNLNFLSLLNVKYVISDGPLNHPALRAVYDRNVKIYENITVLPRAFLYDKVSVITDADKVYAKMNDNTFKPRDSLILAQELDKKLDTFNIRGDEATIEDFRNNSLRLKVNAPGNSMLFLGDIYYPEWKAYIDGKETRIYEAFGLFRAVYLEKGEHTVEFKYSKDLFYAGLAVTLLSISGLILLILKEKKKKQIAVTENK